MTGLGVTGAMDDETHDMMLKPRCGMPDMIPTGQLAGEIMLDPTTNQHQAQAYYTPGYKWNKNNLKWSVFSYSNDMNQGSQRFVYLCTCVRYLLLYTKY